MLRAPIRQHGLSTTFSATKISALNRPFTHFTSNKDKALPPRRKILESEIDESFLKGSGPGGQKINKTSSAVQLRHLPTGIVVKCQDQRSREFNRKVARELLGEKLMEMEMGDKSRTAIKADRARKKKASANKKSKRKYRRLEEEDKDSLQDGDSSREEGNPVSGGAVVTESHPSESTLMPTNGNSGSRAPG